MAIPVDVKITIVGQPLPFGPYTLSIQQELFTHHSFEVTVPYEMLDKGDNGFINQAHEKYCGKPIRIEVTQKPPRVGPRLEFEGIITNIVLANYNSADDCIDFNHRFVLSGYSPTYVLEGGSRRRTFHHEGLMSIFKEVLKSYPNDLPRKLLAPQHQQPVEYAVQYDESPYAFLRRLADEYGEWFYYDGTCLRLGLPIDESPLRFEVQSRQTFDLAISLKPSNLGLSRYDYLTPYRQDGLSESQPLSQLSTFTRFALNRSDHLFPPAQLTTNRHVHSESELTTAIRQRRQSWASRLVTFKGKGENPGFGVGKQVEVGGSRQGNKLHDYGRYRVTRVTHTIKGDMYENEFEALPDAAQHPPTNPLVQPPQGVPELARVISLEDPQQLGRIQVRYFWPVAAGRNRDAQTDWVRVSTPYSGKGHGQLFTPEKGSEVLVGYEQGRPEFPVVLGNLFYPKNEQQATDYTYPENHLKFIRTAGGNTIAFDDQDKGERIIITNLGTGNSNSQLEISFADSGAIRLTTQGEMLLGAGKKITLRSKEIELLAGDKIKLQTDEAKPGETPRILLDGTEIKIGGTSVAIEGEADVKIEASEKLKMLAENASLHSTHTTIIQGGQAVRIN